MDNASLATQAVAESPSAFAPAAFNGIEWLVALNIWSQTAAALIAAMALVTIITDGRKHRDRDVPGASPARLWRWIGALFSISIMVHCGAAAVVLWGWDIERPEQTGSFLFFQRLVDPVAIVCGVAALMLFVLSLPGMLHQLRRKPLPIDVWQAWPIVRRMLAVTLVFFVAAVGVTVTR